MNNFNNLRAKFSVLFRRFPTENGNGAAMMRATSVGV